MKYILVHGTFDTDESLEGDRWWQKGSMFWRKLTEHVAEQDIIQFRWSGENSEDRRIDAARDLKAQIYYFARTHPVTVVSHSHGGNLCEIARMMLPREKKKWNVNFVSVGTPFLKSKVKLQYQLGIILNLTAVIIAVLLLIAINAYLQTDPGFSWEVEGMTIVGIIFGYLPLLLYIPIYNRMQRRRNRLSLQRGEMQSSEFKIIQHPADEAIELLAQVLKIRPKIFRLQQVSSMIIGISVPLSTLTIVAGFVLALIWIINFADTVKILMESIFQIFIIIALFPILFAVLISAFAIVLFFISLFVSPFLQSFLNNQIASSLHSVAFGLRPGQRVESVSNCPRLPHTIVALPNDIVDELKHETKLALGSRLSELNEILSVDVFFDTDILEMLQSSFEWNELIHTYYFRHSECCQFIVDTVVGKHK